MKASRLDPLEDSVDATWWEGVVATAITPGDSLRPEYLSPSLRQAASDPAAMGLKKLVLETLADASSAMLNAENWNEPFAPFAQWESARSVLPADLDDERIALLGSIAALITNDRLRARVADVAWFYGDRSDKTMLERAIDAYRATPLTDLEWREEWTRAFQLAARHGAAGDAVMREMSGNLLVQIRAGKEAVSFRLLYYAEVLRKEGRYQRKNCAEVVTILIDSAAQVVSTNPRLSRYAEREAIAWMRGSDPAAASAATDRIGRSYVSEADARIATDPDSGTLVEGHFLEKAVAVLQTLPRSYRQEHNVDELVENLRVRIRGSREATLEQMMRIETDAVDLTEAASYARSRVAGHVDKTAAVARFATLVPPMNEANTRQDAANRLSASIMRIFASATLSSDARKVAAHPASGSQENEPAVWAEMVRTVSNHALMVATGLIQPAMEILDVEHRIDRAYLVGLCSESPTVPQGQELLWGAGLALGFAGDYGTAVVVVTPLIENAVRVQLQRHGAHTLVVEENGVEAEKGLGSLLEMPEATEVFGSGLVMEMQAMLVTRGGPNLRNEVAHGLLNDAAAWSYSALYVWWFALRMVMRPLINMQSSGDGEVHGGDNSAAAGSME